MAWGVGLASCAAFGWGTIVGWIVGAVLLQLWYLLDHVDGQLARYHGAASLDGTQLDYLMHHTISLLAPIGLGWGLAWQRLEPLWLIAGIGCGVGLLLLGLLHDARYKAFIKRLKRVRGQLVLIGGGGGIPTPTPAMPRRPRALLVYLARKFCEIHVIMNATTAIAVLQWLLGDEQLLIGRIYLSVLASLAVTLSAASLAWSLRRSQAEQEFAAWFCPPEGCALVFRDGWWEVQPLEESAIEESNPSTCANRH